MSTTTARTRRVLAVGLAFAGLATASISMSWLWYWLTSTGQPYGRLWPLPGLYLVEAVLLPALVLWAVTVAHRPGARFGAWMAAGAITAMGLLGAMTVGLYMALALFFLIPALVVGDDGRSTMGQKMAGFAVGSIVQAGVMFVAIRYLLQRSMSGPDGG
jgi:hypothetical protein